MTKKTVQFKLPALTPEPDLSPKDPADIGMWVTSPIEPGPVGAGAVEAPAPSAPNGPIDADRPARMEKRVERPDAIQPFLGAHHPSRETARAFVRGVGTLADCGIVLTLGAQAVTREWLSIPLDALQRGFEGLELMRCRTLPEVLVTQADLMQTSFAQAVARGGRITRISLQTIGEAAQAMTPK